MRRGTSNANTYEARAVRARRHGGAPYRLMSRLLVCVCCVVAVLQAAIGAWAAQASPYNCVFSTPRLIFEDDRTSPNGTGPIISPFMLADARGTLHLFWENMEMTGNAPTASSIYYMRRTRDGVWSTPADVLTSPNSPLAMRPRGDIDAQGIMHIVWLGGAGLFYSRASVHQADAPQAWQMPMAIPLDAGVYPPASLRADANGVLHLVYAEKGGDVYHVGSSDNGLSWSAPAQISAAQYDESTSYPHLWIGDNETLYAVWTQLQLPDGYPPTGAYFSSSSDGGSSWSPPVQVAGQNYGEANLIQTSSGQLDVVYHGRSGVGGAFHRWSSDNGVSWSVPITLVPNGQGGLTGAPGLVVDSSATVHMLIAEEYPNVWYGAWNGAAWSSLLDLSTLLPPMQLGYTEQPAIAVGLGNQIHAVFYDRGTRLWYTTCQADARSVSPRDYATPFPATATPTPVATSQNALPLGPSGSYGIDTLPPTPLDSAGWLVWTFLPSVVLVLFVVVAVAVRKRGGR